MQGVLAPVLTPFDRDLNPDAPRFARFCRSLLEEGCAGLAPFGTTSEANSLSLDERERLAVALSGAEIDARSAVDVWLTLAFVNRSAPSALYTSAS